MDSATGSPLSDTQFLPSPFSNMEYSNDSQVKIEDEQLLFHLNYLELQKALYTKPHQLANTTKQEDPSKQNQEMLMKAQDLNSIGETLQNLLTHRKASKQVNLTIDENSSTKQESTQVQPECMDQGMQCGDEFPQMKDQKLSTVENEFDHFDVRNILSHHFEDYETAADAKQCEQEAQSPSNYHSLRQFNIQQQIFQSQISRALSKDINPQKIRSVFEKLNTQLKDHMSYNLKKLIRGLIRELNDLECMAFTGKRFLRNYKRLKLSLNEIERLLLRFEDMYSPAWLRDATGKTAEDLILHAQWKLLYLEQRIQDWSKHSSNPSHASLLAEIHAPCRYQRWSKANIFRNVSYFTVDSKQLQLNLFLQTPLKGGDDRDYMSLKIALRRLILTWKSFLLDQNGSVVKVICKDKIHLNKCLSMLEEIVPRWRGIFGTLFNRLMCVSWPSRQIGRSLDHFRHQEELEQKHSVTSFEFELNEKEVLKIVKLEDVFNDQIQLVPPSKWQTFLSDQEKDQGSGSCVAVAGFPCRHLNSNTDLLKSKKATENDDEILSKDGISQIVSADLVQ